MEDSEDEAGLVFSFLVSFLMTMSVFLAAAEVTERERVGAMVSLEVQLYFWPQRLVFLQSSVLYLSLYHIWIYLFYFCPVPTAMLFFSPLLDG